MKNLTKLTALTLTAALALTACGSSAATTAPAAESAAGSTAEAASGDLLSEIQAKGTITVAMEGTWAPWTYHDEDDNLVGYDVEVVTHEAGHAFAAYMNRDRIPYSYVWPSMEACEVHSMSMEFFAWPWADGFFGADARKFRYSHLAGALTFIPYGTMVDHFQHIVYEHPELTPAQRHEEWKKLAAIYQPWMRLDGEIPFYGAGEYWQRQMHIYQSPFYYIDYCLAQTVSLQFWAMLQKDRADAWSHYMAYTKQGGSRTFTELLENAGLTTPFEESCLRGVSEAAKAWLDSYDLTGIV